ncbi:heat-shock protein [Campylobacter fetus subsp. testudinum]|uniref:Endoribonuclease YbeY n=1 Tax=Campylobacter fetus subsp. testudinum TaxID=1507806 RepID=A0AAX0H8V4_CAMFE|nr:rRNA maturation RNase YbeY [Campylobacter fetus]AJB45119.1 heat-shock protein [Campylobacter fetus subsp. testudinum]AVK80788.1 rRNA maturation RNase YbeY [Campylobacter fetus subsp. testudinum]EAK0830871.1 rRNA maturation RNase YbeY [Campylobacter fetus]MPB71744.1 rRNA maturation RNase YbeY [Campylobacter fetus]MPB77654.1 rRNA maturation RNase YbeY [Campylobacter fetus]
MIICNDSYPSVLDKIADMLTKAEVELVFVSNEEMREINRDKRGIDKTTDVLSFPLTYVPHFPIGSIVINTDLASSKAFELGHNKDDEIALLFTHGLLHILGFDHENDDGEMRRKEISIMELMGLPKSLIVRNGC